MAAPNVANPTTITGKTTYVTLSSATETTLLSNAASSNKAFRVSHITATNTGSSPLTLTTRIYTAASEGTAYQIGTTLNIPVGAVLIVVGKENPIWLEEDKRLTVQASASGIDVVCSYEDIS